MSDHTLAPSLSERVQNLSGSPVRAMLNIAMQPDMISFAGGLPAPDSFDDLDFAAPPNSIMQYGPTEGDPALREKIAEELQALGLDSPAERVMVLSGSQQGVDLAAKLTVDAGTDIAVESPAYLAALQVFRFFGAELSTIDPAAPGKGWTAERHPALAYVTPTFQNPTGRCWSTEERLALAGACKRTGTILFEDDPYRDLIYDDVPTRPISAQMEGGSWIYQGSFSKTVAPGLRLGFLAASQDLFPHLAHLKQAADLHTNRLSQWLVLNYLNDPGRGQRMSRLAARYHHRRDRFDAALHRHLDGLADWNTPPGGLFFWLTLKDGMDAESLLAKCVERGVLFTPGRFFMADGDTASSCMRLNFSHAGEEAAERGLKILADVIREVRG
jgi:DNA-binding transcriptional MocR family regulator